MKVPGSLVGGHSGARCLTTPENVGVEGVESGTTLERGGVLDCG